MKHTFTKVAVVSDNLFLSRNLLRIIASTKLETDFSFDFFCSPTSPLLEESIGREVTPILLKRNPDAIAGKYQVILSAHCKQIFPETLVKAARCANIHPGLNPYNRGWYPQVFSILNKKPWGATFHIIDNELDHGSIIAQKQLPLFKWDTSLTAYERVQDAEVELLERWLESFLRNEFEGKLPANEGNVNLKKDFNELLHLDLNRQGTLAEHIDLLRALTHGRYKNAYFIDPQTGQKIFVNIQLSPESE